MAEFYLETVGRADVTLKRAMEGLTDAELRQQVAGPQSNPIGWLVWHLTRTRDSIVANFSGTKTLWETEWAAKLGMDANPPQYKPEDVHTFDPKSVDLLMGFFGAVEKHTADIVGKLNDADLERMVQPMVQGRPPASVAARLGVILNDNIQHIGQVAYLRGMLREQGWF